MKFKQFILEMEGNDPDMISNNKKNIIDVLNQMDDDEIDDFGYWIYTNLYDDGQENEGVFNKNEVIEMLNMLDADDLDYIWDYMNDEDDIVDNVDTHTALDVTEKKFFKKKKIQLDREKKQDRAARRKAKKQRHKDYKKHKAQIKIKHKKYLRKVKRNPNLVRHHR